MKNNANFRYFLQRDGAILSRELRNEAAGK